MYFTFLEMQKPFHTISEWIVPKNMCAATKGISSNSRTWHDMAWPTDNEYVMPATNVQGENTAKPAKKKEKMKRISPAEKSLQQRVDLSNTLVEMRYRSEGKLSYNKRFKNCTWYCNSCNYSYIAVSYVASSTLEPESSSVRKTRNTFRYKVTTSHQPEHQHSPKLRKLKTAR